MHTTDIYSITKSNCNNILKSTNKLKTENLVTKFKKIEETEYKMHLHNDIYLAINSKNKSKKCELNSYENHQLYENLLIVNYNVTKLPIFSVPIINQYNDVFNRHITTYEHGLNIIRDYYPEDTIIFIRLENKQINIDHILKLIK